MTELRYTLILMPQVELTADEWAAFTNDVDGATGPDPDDAGTEDAETGEVLTDEQVAQQRVMNRTIRLTDPAGY